jgi:hypothetical protein
MTQQFKGEIGQTFKDSKAWWPDPPKPPEVTCPPITDPVVELGSNMGEGSNASKTLYPGTNHQ